MSYSISIEISNIYKSKEIEEKLLECIRSDIKRLNKNGFYLYEEPVYINENIPYKPENIDNMIGINLHLINEISLNYYYHKLINIAKIYGVKKKHDNFNQMLNSLYYDNEEFLILDNSTWQTLRTKNSNLLNKCIFEDRFNINTHKQFSKNPFSMYLNMLKNRDLKKIKKILNV